MTITVTSIKLKSLWNFFWLSYLGLTIVKQTKTQKGFIKLKNTGFGYLHYTMSCWESAEDVKHFAHSGAHLEAMKSSSRIATEIRIYTFQSEQMPSWKEVKQLVHQKGIKISYT